jgi:hypothetical protein
MPNVTSGVIMSGQAVELGVVHLASARLMVGIVHV